MESDSWSPSEKYRIVLSFLEGKSEEDILAEDGIPVELCRKWTELFLAGARNALSCLDIGGPPDMCKYFSDLVRSIPHAVFCKDLEGRLTYGNTAYSESVRLTPEELIGKRDYDIHTAEAAEKYREDDRRVVETGTMFSCQEENVLADGTVRWAEVVKTPLRDELGNITGVMGMYWDITERKRVENALRDSRENLESQIRKRTWELLEANRRLEKAARLRSDFISSVSHELRTPLTSILGFAKLIRRDMKRLDASEGTSARAGERWRERIGTNAQIITDEGIRLKRLIDDLLDFEKIGSGKMHWIEEVFNLNTLAEASVRAMQGLFASKPDVTLKCLSYRSPVFIKADQDRIKQVFLNLLSNAAKFTDKGSVTVSVAKRDDLWAEAWVCDTGQGISTSDIGLIFEDYYQVSQAEDRERGTGLGLPICQQIITHYRGKFWVESSPGVGSTFHFMLPLHSSETESG